MEEYNSTTKRPLSSHSFFGKGIDLYRYFPELSYSISKRYQEYLIASGQETRQRIRQEIFEAAQLLHSQGYKPTQSRVTNRF